MSTLVSSRWPTVPLKHLARFNERTLPDDTDPNFEFEYIDIGLVDGGQLIGEPERMSFAQAPSRARRLVRQGETIVSTVRTYLRAVWTVSGDPSRLVVSTGFAVISPGNMVAPRFMSWWLQSDPFVEEIVARSVGVSYPAINPAELSSIRTPIPPLYVQKRIANFLDAKTTRIDTLIAKKRQMLQLLTERSAGIVERSVRDLAGRHGEQRLKTAVGDVTVGIVVTPSVWYSEEGVPALRGLNVRPHKIDLSDLVRLSAEGHRIHAKSKLYAGDVVVVRTGQAGAAAVVPPALNGANCIDLLIVRPGSLGAKFLTYVLNSDWTHKHISKYSVGTIQSHFNVSSLAELPIPAVPLDEQRRFVLNIDAQLARLEAAHAKLRDQLELLREHRQALITAAVTGEMDVPGVPA